MSTSLISDYLTTIEQESIRIIREAVAEAVRPVMLYSIGKDSSVMLHLALKAFFPMKPPFPLLHVDTTWKFREMINFREETVDRLGLELITYTNEDGLRQGISPFSHGSRIYTDIMKTEALKKVLDTYRFDMIFGGARRDEEKSRAKERVFSFRDMHHRWSPRSQRPELWHIPNLKKNSGESFRVFPLSSWTELDIWRYIERERIPVVPLYFAAKRPVVQRNGQWIMADDDRMQLDSNEAPHMRQIRFRTLGCYPLTAGVESSATTTADIVRELEETHTSERCGRLIDFDQSGSMEKKKTGWLLLMSENTGVLRFLACGSVDDGKSTMIGHLLHRTNNLYDDQLKALQEENARIGTTEGVTDYSLLLDGLMAEREQGITIDVAYRYFSTLRRKFIVADTPGHENYTRNMTTAASQCGAALILIDVRQGIVPQTRRHILICAMMGIEKLLFAVNKMDLVGWSEQAFQEVVVSCNRLISELVPLGFTVEDFAVVPVSALHGDNLTEPSARMPWYTGANVLEWLETSQVDYCPLDRAPFRFPVQYVIKGAQSSNCWQHDFANDFRLARTGIYRAYAGTIVSGAVRQGDKIMVLPSGVVTTVSGISSHTQGLDSASAGMAISLLLEGDYDIARGDIIVPEAERPEMAAIFKVRLVWMDAQPFFAGRQYLFKNLCGTATAEATRIRGRIDLVSFQLLSTDQLGMNDLGEAELIVSRSIPYDPYHVNRETGGFILIDRLTNATVACGMIRYAMRRAANVHWQREEVSRKERSKAMGQKPAVIWLTGLSGAGKSTIANCLERKLLEQGYHTVLLDGDNVRHGLNKDLGFSEADRIENIRRIGEVAKLMVDAGLIVITAFISPYKAERDMARRILPGGDFIEVFVDTPLMECERRDPKGLYRKARLGQIPNFTGINSPYQAPDSPEIRLDTTLSSAEECAGLIMRYLTHARL